ncbi:unnamed protein product [Paramecium sonneborni]|uniref:Uncharacterized protein n=1 Tax=Paramecium sonneborni TaxID=65129 RepID=A0A8S1JUT3_9CILI|nr:unnamed protein product [Paramecium sonneborni]
MLSNLYKWKAKLRRAVSQLKEKIQQDNQTKASFLEQYISIKRLKKQTYKTFSIKINQTLGHQNDVSTIYLPQLEIQYRIYWRSVQKRLNLFHLNKFKPCLDSCIWIKWKMIRCHNFRKNSYRLKKLIFFMKLKLGSKMLIIFIKKYLSNPSNKKRKFSYSLQWKLQFLKN